MKYTGLVAVSLALCSLACSSSSGGGSSGGGGTAGASMVGASGGTAGTGGSTSGSGGSSGGNTGCVRYPAGDAACMSQDGGIAWTCPTIAALQGLYIAHQGLCQDGPFAGSLPTCCAM